MSGNLFGRIFRIMTWGESHGPMIGAVIDGCPSNLEISECDIERILCGECPDSQMKTPRNEKNKCRIVSGVFQGKTLGTPISILIENLDVKTSDYDSIKDMVRPGHGDFTWRERFGHIDWRGGGRSSGREAAARIAASGIAVKILDRWGITVKSTVKEIHEIPNTPDNLKQIKEDTEFQKKTGNSTGGVVEIECFNVPSGVGNPVFEKMDSLLAGAFMGIGGVKAVECGEGIQSSKLTGSENNDAFFMKKGKIQTETNRCGGILGGITTGNTITFRLFVKPVPSIYLPQNTVNYALKTDSEIEIQGRFDANMTPRIGKVAVAMANLVLVDQLMLSGLIPLRL